MPAHRKHEYIQGQYFRWRLFRRNGVWYADGRFEELNLGKHSLGTRDKADALSQLRKLDFTKAFEHGFARDIGVDLDNRLDINQGWEMYLEHCDRPEVMGGVCRKTLNKYKRSRELHCQFCNQQRIRYWNDFGQDELNRYGRSLDPRFAARSLYFELTEIKTVINWLTEAQHLPRETRFRLRLRRPDGTDRYCYTQEQVVAMIQNCDENVALHWLRDIIVVLACTGLRISELVSLRWSDLDIESCTIRLTDERASKRRTDMGSERRMKGRRGRLIPMHPEVKALAKTLPRRLHGRVLCGPRGGKIKADRARETFVARVITPLSEQYPTPENEIGFAHARFHSFRHYFISQAFLNGATEGEIMEWVGHRDSKTVALYRHLRNEESQRRMRQINFVRPQAQPDVPAPAT